MSGLQEGDQLITSVAVLGLEDGALGLVDQAFGGEVEFKVMSAMGYDVATLGR